MWISYKNLVLEQNNFYLISLSILITCLLDNVWILLGEVTCESLLGVKGLSVKISELLVDVPFLAQDQERIGRSKEASIGSHARELLKSGTKL